MTVYVADAHAHVQRLISIVEMTVLESILLKSSVLLFDICGQKDSMQRIFIKKCSLFTVGSVLRVKRFTTKSRNSVKDVRK
jgi:competence protein ComGF